MRVRFFEETQTFDKIRHKRSNDTTRFGPEKGPHEVGCIHGWSPPMMVMSENSIEIGRLVSFIFAVVRERERERK
jgi:hypothetical protein